MRTKIIGRLTALGVVLFMLVSCAPVLFSENARGYNGVFHFDPSLPLDKNQGYVQTDIVRAGQEYQFRWWYDGPEVLGGSILYLFNATSNEMVRDLGYVGMEEPDYYHWHYDWLVTNDLAKGTYYMRATGQDGSSAGDSATFEVDASPSEDTTPPTVVSVTPAGGSTNVNTESKVTVEFSEPMDKASVEAAFSLSEWVSGEGNYPVLGSFSWPSDSICEFTPYGLSYHGTYSVSIGTGAKDLAGNALVSQFSSGFWTEWAVPKASMLYPTTNGTTDVPIDAVIKVYFDQYDMDLESIRRAFSLSANGAIVPGTVDFEPIPSHYDTTHMLFTPTEPLQYSTEYTVTVTTEAMNGAGLSIEAPLISTFTTEASDVQDVEVTVTAPSGGETWRVGETHEIDWSISLPSGAVLLDQEVYLMNDNGLDKIAVLGPEDRSFAWTIPSYNIEYLTNSWIQIQVHVQEASGEAFHLGKSSNFTIAAKEDKMAPFVVSSYPADGAVDVMVSTNVTDPRIINLTFSERMNHSSVESVFQIAQDGKVMDLDNVSWPFQWFQWSDGLDGTENLSFNLNRWLWPETVYTVTIGTGAKDLAGNALAAPFSFSFTTEKRPRVASVVPSDGATEVSTSTSVQVTFDMPMDTWSVEDAFRLTPGGPNGTSVAGTFAWSADDTVCTFTPLEPLAYSTQHTVFMNGGLTVESKHMTFMPSPFYSNFTTEENPDTEAPTISAPSPVPPLTMYTKDTSTTLTFSALYSDNVGVTKVMAFLDEVNMTEQWSFGASSFSQDVELGTGQHTLVLKVRDVMANEATQTWNVTLIQDTTGPTISGYVDGQIIKDVTATPTIGAKFTDAQSGVNANTTVVMIDGKDVTSSATVYVTSSPTGSEIGFTYPTNKLSNGAHTVRVTVQDRLGNSATASWTVQVSTSGNPGNPDTTLPSIQSIKYDKVTKSIIGLYFDKGSGINTASVKMTVDGKDVTLNCTVTATQITYSIPLSRGNHAVHLEIKDNAGNLATLNQTINVR